MAVLLVGGNLAFSVSAEAPEETGKTEQAEAHNEKETDQVKNNVPDYAPFSETVNKQESDDVQNPGADLSQNEETSTESVDAENSSAADTENESQENGQQLPKAVLMVPEMYHIMKIFRQACHIPVDSVLRPVWHQL